MPVGLDSIILAILFWATASVVSWIVVRKERTGQPKGEQLAVSVFMIALWGYASFGLFILLESIFGGLGWW
jgi:hypothetical protein